MEANDPTTLATNLVAILVSWRKFWRLRRQNKSPQKCWNFLDISIRGGDIQNLLDDDVTSCQGRYKNRGVAEMRQSFLNVCGVRRISLETCSRCELVSCEILSSIVHSIDVIDSDLLSTCTANLCKCCFYCHLRFVFSGIFQNKM
ncbi:hypothetical protein AVEN_127799-1 [Araneus ventricosus]|uniref:Uncharacterized protein n=1 Tax=Araneus ventricosus TaxID=182803 RepID=A0A4Y2DRW3_ARAVE|nr:hypothetical protein AVEN_127799-1 [Araneus ventricosus]